MSKTLRTAALVVGAVALVATGVGALAAPGVLSAAGVGTIAGISAGTIGTIGTLASVGAGVLGLAATLTAKKPKTSLGGDQTKFTANKDQGLPYPVGRTSVSGFIAHRQTHGAKNIYQTFFAVLAAAGPIENVEAFQIDGQTVTFSNGVASGAATGADYAGWMWLASQKGQTPEPAALVSPVGAVPGWDASSKMSGYAAYALTLKYDDKGKVFAAGVPEPSVVLYGVKAYDPRWDSTYPGGDGPCRAGDETTWRYTDNAFLHGLTWLIGRRQNGRRVMGVGAPIAGIDVPAYVEACNIALANGWKMGGLVYSTDEKWAALKAMLQAGGGEPCRIGGMISCIIRAPRVSLDTIRSGDIVGEASVTGTQRRRERINAIVPRYRSEAHDWEMVPAAVVKVDAYVGEDGGQRTREVEYPLVQDAKLAAQLAAYDIVDAREFGPIVLPLKTRWVGYKPGDCLTIDVPELNMVGQTAIVLNRSLDPSTGIVTLTLRSETPAKHDFALGRTASPPPTPSLQVIDPSQLLIPGISAVWGAIADDGDKPEDNATVGATVGVNLRDPNGLLIFPQDIINQPISLSPDGRLTALVDGAPQLLGTLALPDLGAASDSARRQLEADLARISEAVARLAAGQARVSDVFRDAGLYIDPVSGTARLFAVERTAERLNDVTVRLNAALASINLKASAEYVNSQIALASLEPGDAAEFAGILVRLTSAEADIDGLQASILLKADATTVTTLSGAVSSVQTALDALTATVSTKASQTVVEAQEARLTSAEQTLSAMDGASIVQAVAASRRAPAETDAAGEAALAALTLADRAARQAQTGIAQARQELTAGINGATEGFALARLALAVQIGEAKVAVASETAARISGDAASATALAAYKATVDGNLAGINTSLGAVVTQASATAGSFASFQTDVGGNLANIFTNLAAQSGVNQTVAGTLDAFSTTLGGHTATLTAYGSSIDGLGLRNGVDLNSNGYITGFVQNNDGARGDFLVLADRFAVGSPGNPSNVPFEVVDGVTYMKSAVLRNATIGTLKLLDGSVTKSGAVRLIGSLDGNGTTVTALSLTFTLPFAASITVQVAASQGYFGSTPRFTGVLALNGVQIGAGTGGGDGTFAVSFPLLELADVPAGTHSIEFRWLGGSSGIRLTAAVLGYTATFR